MSDKYDSTETWTLSELRKRDQRREDRGRQARSVIQFWPVVVFVLVTTFTCGGLVYAFRDVVKDVERLEDRVHKLELE